VRVAGDELAIAPLRAELQMLKWQIVELEAQSTLHSSPESSLESSLEALGTQHNALAVLRMQVQPLGIDLWLSASTDAASEQRHIAGRRDAHALAVHVVEMLRARWTELRSASRRPTQTPAATDVARDTAPLPLTPQSPTPHAAGPLLWLGFGPSLLVSPKPFEAQPSGHLDLTLEPYELLTLSLTGLFPFTSSTLREPEGQADVSIWSVGTTLAVRFQKPSWQITLGSGITLCWLRVHGTANDPYESENQDAKVRSAHFRVGFGTDLTRFLRLHAAATLGLGIEEARIVMLDRTIARWGRPFGVGELSLQLAVPGT
jgi:hypothetical protein